MSIKKLLVLTELDERTSMANAFAVNLAEQLHHNELILLNVIIPAHSQAFTASGDVFKAEGDMANRFNLALMEKHKKLVESQAAQLTTQQVQVKPYVRFNDNKTHINEYMEEFDCDVIVCGSRDEDSFMEKLFGSETTNLIHDTDFPMIVVKEGTPVAPIHDIAVAIDVEANMQHGLDQVVSFAEAVNAKLQLVYIATRNKPSADDAIEDLRNIALERKMKNYAINVVNNESLESGLRSFVRKYNPDMIAVLSEGKGKLSTLIYGSDTQEIIKEMEKPVFVSKLK